MRSVFDAVKSLASILPQVLTADTNGSSVDTQGYNSAKLVVAMGLLDDASADETYVVNVEESADGSTGWAAISGATLTFNRTTGENTVQNLRLDGLNAGSRKRYLRAVLDVGGTTPSAAISAVIELGRAFKEPVQ